MARSRRAFLRDATIATTLLGSIARARVRVRGTKTPPALVDVKPLIT